MVIISPHTYVCSRPNNSLDLSFFLVKGVLVILLNKQASQVHTIHNQKDQNIFIYVA